MKFWISYYSNPRLAEVPKAQQVAISRGVPRNYGGRRILSLAPTWEMLKRHYSREEYDGLLAKLDPKALARYAGDNAVLLCWEKDGICHRHWVADWLRAAGHEVEEYPRKGTQIKMEEE